jgi:hypothetical protein
MVGEAVPGCATVQGNGRAIALFSASPPGCDEITLLKMELAAHPV